MKHLTLLLSAVLVLLNGTSCIEPEQEEGSVVTLRFATGGLHQTKTQTPGNANVADGGGIYVDGETNNPDLVILIAGKNGSIVKKYPDVGTLEMATLSATEATVSFDFSDRTNDQLEAENPYTVYAFANTRGLNGSKWRLVGQGEKGGLDELDADALLLSLGTSAAVEALQFQTLTKPLRPYGSTVPEGDEDYVVSYMPLSAKGTLNVQSNRNGEVSLELLRCVAKVTAIIKNQTHQGLTLSDYQHAVKGMFPESGYLLSQDPDYADDDPGDLSASAPTVPIGEDVSLPYSWYVFPSEGPYTIDLEFTLFKNQDNERTYTYSGLYVTNDKAQNIPSLERNQHLTVTTRISKGLTISFNFEVADWIVRNETVQFD